MVIFLKSSINQFQQYKLLAEKAFNQLSEKDFYKIPSEESNSIAVIIQHMAGNMISRWTDFLTTDGEKPNRNRDDEFDEHYFSKEKLITKWESGWKCLFDALNLLTEHDLEKIIYIRQQPCTVIEAIHRQLTHYAYHVGQIVYIAKMFQGAEWKNLSIPKKKN